MAKQPWERNRSPGTINTPAVAHEHTVVWLDPVQSGSGSGFRPRAGDAAATDIDLAARVDDLVATLHLPRPTSIDWADLPHTWGRCRTDGVIEISTEALGLPQWVTDGIIVHELAHLAEPGHGPEFKRLVARYQLAREVDGYLTRIQDVDWGISVEPHQHNLKRSDPRAR